MHLLLRQGLPQEEAADRWGEFQLECQKAWLSSGEWPLRDYMMRLGAVGVSHWIGKKAPQVLSEKVRLLQPKGA